MITVNHAIDPSGHHSRSPPISIAMHGLCCGFSIIQMAIRDPLLKGIKRDCNTTSSYSTQVYFKCICPTIRFISFISFDLSLSVLNHAHSHSCSHSRSHSYSHLRSHLINQSFLHSIWAYYIFIFGWG